MNKVEIDQIKLSRRQFVSGSTVALATWIVGCSPAATAPSVAASGITPPPETPLPPTTVPPIPTLAPRPTNAATAVPTIEPSATNAPATATENPSPTPPDTATAVPANTVEATKTPEAKPVLANNAVYSNGKDLVIADLPPDPAKDPSGKHWLFIYEGILTHGNASLNDPVTTGDNSFNVLGFGVQIADAQRDDTKQEITGDWQMKGGATVTPFKLNFKGVGLHVLLHECIAVFTIQQQLGSGKPIPDATMESEINDQFRSAYKGTSKEGVYLHP